jgi:hypothetical protein
MTKNVFFLFSASENWFKNKLTIVARRGDVINIGVAIEFIFVDIANLIVEEALFALGKGG